MKWKNEERDPFVAPASSVLPDYKLNRIDHCLVQVGEHDLRKVVESARSSALDAIIDRFIAGEDLPARDDSYADSETAVFIQDRLDYCTEYVEAMEDIRDQYGLSPDWSPDQIRDFAYSELEKLKKKGGGEGEKTQNAPSQTVEAGQPQSVPQHGETDAQP